MLTLRELTVSDCALAYPAMHALRPHLSEAAFVDRVGAQMEAGYRLVAAFEAEADSAEVSGDTAITAAGFRFTTNLAWGRHLYIDDLSTLPEARGRGGASQLLHWLDDLATAEGADQIHLDSGVQPERQDAHRLYFRNGFRITSFHFARSTR